MLLGKKLPALLVLEDGSVFRGYSFAGAGEVLGEVVFNTAMMGYQEILTDPSYREQIVIMTYPLIGNYGINEEDMESAGIHLEGLIVREYQPYPSNWRSSMTLKEFLEAHGKIGIEEIDTRALTRRIRREGAMRGILSTETTDVKVLLERVHSYPGLVGRDLVSSVSCTRPYRWRKGAPEDWLNQENPFSRDRDRLRVVVVDCGVKYSILRCLENLGCEVLVVPATTGGNDILSYRPDGIVLSNGPGDPAALSYLVDTVRDLLGKVPLFGICLGHQILGQAFGGRTEKLKFGHHGANQPVKNFLTGKVEITSQNHGFVVLPTSLPEDIALVHENLNDRTSEGMYSAKYSAFSVQYHPEASPGPHDARYLFEDFVVLMKKVKKERLCDPHH